MTSTMTSPSDVIMTSLQDTHVTSSLPTVIGNDSLRNVTGHHNVTDTDLIMGYTLIPIFILTVCANLLTIIVAYKLISCNKNITDLFVFFLAWTDLLLGLLVLPLVTISHFTGSVIGGDPVCQFNFFVVNSTVQASAFFVLVMSIERWVAFVKPLHYKSRFTFKLAKILIVTVMVYSVVTSLLPLLGVGEIGNFDYVCMIDWQTKQLDGQVMVWFQVILGLVSILAVWYFNIAVACSVWNMRKLRQNTTRSQDRTRGRMEVKFARLTACVAVFYSICWAPYLIRVIMVQTGSPRDDMVDFLVTRMAAANSMINPIIYGATKRSYLRGYVYVIKECWYYMTCCACIKKPTAEEFRTHVAGRRQTSVHFSTASTRRASEAFPPPKEKHVATKSTSQLNFANLDENQEIANENADIDTRNDTELSMGQINMAFTNDQCDQGAADVTQNGDANEVYADSNRSQKSNTDETNKPACHVKMNMVTEVINETLERNMEFGDTDVPRLNNEKNGNIHPETF